MATTTCSCSSTARCSVAASKCRASADGNALITGGLEDGDEVVTTRLDLMFEGMQVARIDG
jgi:hypothetical protein